LLRSSGVSFNRTKGVYLLRSSGVSFGGISTYDKGTTRGLSIAPLYSGATLAVGKDEQLYKWLACIDVIRVGRAREKKIAMKELEKEIMP